MSQHALSRRHFLTGSATLAALGLAGCSGSGTEAKPAGTGAAGSSIDTFTAGFQGWGASEGLDPGKNTYFIDEARMRALFDYLFELDDTMAAVPRLAERAEPNARGDVWRIHLRDARWHDGTAFTAQDVLYTISRVLGPTTGKPFGAATAMSIVDLGNSKEIDARTVELALKRPSFDFPTTLGVYGMRIVKNGTTRFDKPVGTGPFVFESYQAGTQLTATAYPDYWDGAPAIQRLRILSSEADARVSAVQSGQLDYADELPPSAVARLAGIDTLTVHQVPNCQIFSFIMKSASGPFADPAVRQAMRTMIDRQEMVKVALEGQGQVGNDLFGQNFQYYAADLPQYEYDPAKTKAALAAAGVPDLAFTLFTAPATPGFTEAAKLLADQAVHSGVKVTVDTGSKDTYYTEYRTRGDLVMSRSGPMPLPNHFALRLLSDSPQNVGQWKDPEFNTLYAKAQQTQDDTARTAVYHDMQEILHARGPWLLYATGPWRTAAKTGFTGLDPAPTNTTNYARFNKVGRA